MKVLSSIVFDYVTNQSRGHWLLAYVLQFIVSTCQNIREELAQPIFNNDVEEDLFDYELNGVMA